MCEKYTFAKCKIRQKLIKLLMFITKVIKQSQFTYGVYTNVNKIIYKWNVLTEILVSPISLQTLYLYEFYRNIIMLNKKALSKGAPSFS